MFLKRLFCVFGFHTWGNWQVVRSEINQAPIYKRRQCAVCGRFESDMEKCRLQFIN